MSISVKAQTKSFAGQSFSRKYAKELLQGVVASRPFGRRTPFEPSSCASSSSAPRKRQLCPSSLQGRFFFGYRRQERGDFQRSDEEAIYSLAANASVSSKRSIKSHVGGYAQRCPFMVQAVPRLDVRNGVEAGE